jgi:hypothetical protein
VSLLPAAPSLCVAPLFAPQVSGGRGARRAPIDRRAIHVNGRTPSPTLHATRTLRRVAEMLTVVRAGALPARRPQGDIPAKKAVAD